MGPIECLGSSPSEYVEECIKILEEKLRSEVIVEMRLDPNCPEMTFVDNLSDVKSFGKEADYIYPSVDDYRKVNKQMLFLSIEHINGNEVVLSKNGLTSSTKEAAHKLCYIIHQEKITRR